VPKTWLTELEQRAVSVLLEALVWTEAPSTPPDHGSYEADARRLSVRRPPTEGNEPASQDPPT